MSTSNPNLENIKKFIANNNIATPKKPGLGKGLAALLSSAGDTSQDAQATQIVKLTPAAGYISDSEQKVVHLNIKQLRPSAFQPRTQFDEEKLQELSESIRAKGVLQPVLVRKAENDFYELVAGERRWRAATLAGLESIPALVFSFTDKEVLEIGLIENLQRQNLNPIDEAKGFSKLIKEFAYTHADLADTLGINRSYVTNLLRILTLPETVQKYIEEGKLTVGHAKVIVNYEYPMELAEKIIEDKLTVRDTEKIVHYVKIQPEKNPIKKLLPYRMRTQLNASDKQTVKHLADNTKALFKDCIAKVKVNEKGGGYIKIEFNDLQRAVKQVESLIDKLK